MTAMRSKSYTALQKTYDQCYLTCSTAIFYESQGNVLEALRCWRDCMNQIQCHNARHRSGSNWRASRGPKSDTEKTLEHALKTLELQCQERMDLLEALRVSRLEAAGKGLEGREDGPARLPPLSMPSPTAFGGKELPPPLPPRPQPERQTRPPPQTSAAGPSSTTTSPSRAIPPAHIVYPKLGRTSPEKNTTFVQTLRSRKTAKNDLITSTEEGGTAAKAATLAWGTPNGGRTFSGTLLGDQELKERSGVGKLALQSTSNLIETPIQRAYTANALASASPGAKPRQLSTLLPSNNGTLENVNVKVGKLASDRPQSSQGTPYLQPPVAEGAARRRSLDIERKPVPQQHDTEVPVPPIPPKHFLRPTHASKSAPEILRIQPSSQLAPDTISRPIVDYSSDRQINKSKGSLASDSVSEESEAEPVNREDSKRNERIARALKQIQKGVDEHAVRQILNEIVVKGDEVHWDDVAGLETAKLALKEAVVYPFLRPDLFMGLREPARGMLLFGPPGTGKTMIARAVATESNSTFFSISASSLTSKYLGESEKLVRALFALAKALAPSIIFVDEIDSLLSSRSVGEHEATRRIKTEFLIQWSDLQKAAAGKDTTVGDASRVLVLAATNLPWAIDEAARRRFVRRQYIPLPEAETRRKQFERLLSHQKHELTEEDITKLVELTDGFSGSDITALAKDAAMGPLRSLGEALLHMKMEQIRPMSFEDFGKSLASIKSSVSKDSLQQFEDWARQYGERA